MQSMAKQSTEFRRAKAAPAALLLLSLAASWIAQAGASIPRSFAGSDHSHSCPEVASDRPAWNASSKINPQGYLCELFRRIPGEWEADCPPAIMPCRLDSLNVPVAIRQVPGDGDCLFHAIAVSLNLIQGGRHVRMDSATSLGALKETSRQLRRMAVECLRSCNVGRSHKSKRNPKKLFIQGHESMPAPDLLSSAASQYGISPEEYCDLMEQDSYWGGGPEIVALCNVLKRPIHVYELVATAAVTMNDDDAKGRQELCAPDHLVNEQFRLRRMATFGSPKYDSRSPLHILSADSRFPDIQPECIMDNGNHFMAIFTADVMKRWVNHTPRRNSGSGRFDNDQKRHVRGGAASLKKDVHGSLPLKDPDEAWRFHREWFDDFKYSSSEDGSGFDPSSLSVVRHYRYRKMFHLWQKQHMTKRRKQSLKHFISIWINAFVWTMSHFQLGLE